MERQRSALMGNHDRHVGPVDLPASRQNCTSGLAKQVDERPRGAVQTRRFRRVKLHKTIVDPETRKRGKHVLDKRDMGRWLSQRRPALGSSHLIDARRNSGMRPKVGANKNDPGGSRGRMESDMDPGPSQESGTDEVNRPGERPLVAMAEKSHVCGLP